MIWLRVLRYFLMCVFFLAIGMVWSVEYPRIKSWLLLHIDSISQSQADLSVKAKDIKFKIFPPGIELSSLNITPGQSLKSILSPTQIDSVGIFLNIAALLDGRVEVEEVVIDHPVTSLAFNPTSDAPKKKHRNADLWDQLITIPIHGITIKEANFQAAIKSVDLRIEGHHFNLHAEKSYSAAKIEVIAPNLEVQSITTPERNLNIGFMTRVIVEKQAIEMSALKIALGKNYVIARGVGRGDLINFEFPFINGRMITDFDLAETREAIHLFNPHLNIPSINGHLDIDINAQAERGHEVQVNSLLRGDNLTAGKFVIGDFNGKVQYEKSTIRASEFKFHNSSGNAHLENVTIQNTPDKKFSSRIFLDNIELRQFLDNINVKNVPLHMDITGAVPCEGTLTPLLIQCAGDIEGKNFQVWTPNKKTIVVLNEFKITSQMGVDKDHVWFPKGLLSIGNSVGIGSGEVSFANGFSFSYHTDKLDSADIKNLADLKFLGGIALDGTTHGTGKTGVIDAQVRSPQLWFENYGLGAIDLHFHYENNIINFTDIAGKNGNLAYNGNVRVRVSDEGDQKMGVQSAHVEIPHLDMADLQNGVFGKKITLPLTSAGQGSATIDAFGPFSLSQLNYTIKSDIHHVMAAGESFDHLRFNIHGIKGHAYIDDITAQKGHGTFVWSGDIQPTGAMNIDIQGRNLRIADFENGQQYAHLDGQFFTDIHLRDSILDPKISAHGSITQMSLNERALDDSNFEMGFSSNGFNLDGKFFNEKVTTHLTYPFKPHQPFSFKFNAVNWDFSSLLGIISSTEKKDYETSLSAKIDIANKDGDFMKSSGDGILSQLSIRHGNSQMKNTRPITVHLDEGQVTINQAHFEGDNTQFSFSGTKNRKDMLNFNVNGQIDLSLLTFLTPFLRDMGGELSLSTQVAGTLQKPDLLGSAFIKKGYFKLNALPQPFEDINADMLFSQTRILINHLRGHFGGGDLTASGAITFKEIGDIPVEITGDLVHGGLTFPEGLLTHGDFHFGITGSWFPYILKGDYAINDGIYTKNFGNDSNDLNIKRSIYLPKVILQKDFTPFEVDIASHFPKGVIVRNKLMDAEVRGNLEVKGDPSHALLKGEVTATPNGKVFFRETPFTITEMTAKFNNPSENDPNLYVLATSKVRDYDITLLLKGTPQKYQLDLTSSPPLSNKSIVSLLALGVTDEEENKVQQSLVTPNPYSNTSSVQSQGQVQTYEAGTLLLQDNPLKNELKQRYGVDVRLSQTVDDLHNIVMPRVIAEKQWTPRISTSVSRTVGDRVTQDAVIQYKLDKHFSILGSFEERDYDMYAIPGSTGIDPNPTSSILGLDLQYQVEFK